MLIVSSEWLGIERTFSIFLLHEKLLHKDMAVASEQVYSDYRCVFNLDALF